MVIVSKYGVWFYLLYNFIFMSFSDTNNVILINTNIFFLERY